MLNDLNKLMLLVLTAFGLFCAQTVYCQTEKLGVVKYTSPRGMTKLPKENTIIFSEFDQATGKFCIITLYGATPGTGTAAGDFAREWNNLVLKTFTTAEREPSTATSSENGWTATGAGSEVEGAIGKAVAFLTVISGFGQTVSILGVFNDQSHAAKLDAFMSSVEMDKVQAPPANNTAATGSASGTAAFDADGNLIIPQPARQLTTSDIAGVWIDGPNRMTTEYVYSGSGKSAGRDTTAFEVKTTFKTDGTFSSFFNSVRNKYETESDTQTGPYAINGRLLSIQGKGYSGKPRTTKYVIRGWVELPTMTVLELAGPWYDNDPIPEVNFTDFGPDSKYRGVTKWIRIR